MHGAPLGEENVKALKENLGWPEPEKSFNIPQEVYTHYQELAKKGEQAEAEWNKLFADYCAKFPEEKARWDKFHAPVDAQAILDDESFWAFEDKPMATRNTSGVMINRIKDKVQQLIGGSADLAPSNKTHMNDESDFKKGNYIGRNLHFGIRELAMAAMANGITLHGGLRVYVGTFFVFCDYMKPMMRLAALMHLPVTYVLTHDSIGVGEDGPTHEPIEQLAMLRALPNLNVFRPADGYETAAGWYLALTAKDTPTALVLTRQNLPQLKGSSKDALKGAYVVSEAKDPAKMQGILIASGSEVSLAIEAQAKLAAEGIDVRVVSMPCQELFNAQSAEYKESILPNKVRARVAIEALSGFGWEKYTGLDGAVICMPGFGASGPASQLFEHFGFTPEHVVEVTRKVIAANK